MKRSALGLVLLAALKGSGYGDIVAIMARYYRSAKPQATKILHRLEQAGLVRRRGDRVEATEKLITIAKLAAAALGCAPKGAEKLLGYGVCDDELTFANVLAALADTSMDLDPALAEMELARPENVLCAYLKTGSIDPSLVTTSVKLKAKEWIARLKKLIRS